MCVDMLFYFFLNIVWSTSSFLFAAAEMVCSLQSLVAFFLGLSNIRAKIMQTVGDCHSPHPVFVVSRMEFQNPESSSIQAGPAVLRQESSGFHVFQCFLDKVHKGIHRIQLALKSRLQNSSEVPTSSLSISQIFL